MIRQNAYRFALTVLLLVFAGFTYYSDGSVPEWLVGLVGFSVGNSFRLQAGNGKT